MGPLILRISMVIAGIMLIIVDVNSYIYKKLTEKVALIWLLAGVVMILFGTVPVLADWSYTMNNSGFLALLAFLAILLMITFKLTMDMSMLKRKNQELAMQVSLLNQESEKMQEDIAELKKTIRHIEKKD